MKSKPVIIAEDFYDNPDKVREYALNCDYYVPYGVYGELEQNNPEWFSSLPSQRYVTEENISKLESLIGAKIDRNHFNVNIPTSEQLLNDEWLSSRDNGTAWNAGFQVKLPSKNPAGAKGIHNHYNDSWNHCGDDGWAAVVFLTPNDISYENNGFDLWKSKYGTTYKNVEERTGNVWIDERVYTPPSKINEPAPIVSINGEWNLSTRIQFKYNTLVLHSAVDYHAGSNGWGDSVENGRMIQTFFFKEKQ